jgi:rhamnosyltransferase
MKKYKVAVLMATFNGLEWLSEQILSIAEQYDVDVELFVSDDKSTDGTLDYLKKLNLNIPLHVLPVNKAYGAAVLNFFRLIRDVNFSKFDYIFLSDQDDIWKPDKIKQAISFMSLKGVDCYASNLICTFSNGDRKLLRKDFPQTKNDFLFQSASAGCTYGLHKSVALELQEKLRSIDFLRFKFSSHDWIIYAFSRSRGYTWCIDSTSYIDYRQHPNNVWGALGVKSYLKRWRLLRSGWYRNQIILISELCILNSEQKSIVDDIKKWNIFSRLKLSYKAHSFRRRIYEKIATSFMLLFGIL